MNYKHLKSSLPILLRMVCNKMGVSFRIEGTSAYTDGKAVVVPYGDFNDPKYCKQVLGMTVHEGGHLLFTDLDAYPKMPDESVCKAEPVALPRFKLHRWLTNAFDDVQQEVQTIERYPGARMVLSDTVESIKDDPRWCAEVTEDDSPLSALQGYVLYRLRAEVLEQPLLNHAVQAERVVRAKLGDELTAAITDKMFEVRQITQTIEANRIANEVLELVEQEIAKLAPPPPEPSNADPGDEQPDDGQSSAQADDPSQQPGDSPAPDNGDGDELLQSLQQLFSGEDTGRSADLSEAFNKAVEDAAEAYQSATGDTGRGMDLDGEVEIASKGADGTASRLYSQVSLSTTKLSGQLQSLLESLQDDQLENVTAATRVDVRGLHRLYRGQTDVFLEEHEVEQVDTAVFMLLDRSTSMTNLISLAQQCVASAALAVEKVPDAKVSVAAFPGDSASVMRLTAPGESVRRTLDRYCMGATGGTPTAEALWWVGSEVVRLGASRNIVMLATDGEPNSPAQAQRVINILRMSGVEVIGIGIGNDGKSAVHELLGGIDACGVSTIDQLAPELFAVLRRKLTLALAA